MKKALIFLGALGLASCGGRSSGADFDPNTLVANSFETLGNWMPEALSATLTQEQAHTGKTSLKVDEAHEFSLSYSNLLGRLRPERLTKIRVSAWAFVPSPQASATLVVSVNDPAAPAGQPLLWEGIKLNEAVKTYGKWMEVSRVITLPARSTAVSRLSLYLWRTGGNQPVYIDDLKVAVAP